MNFKKMYEKASGLISLEIFDYSIETFEKEFRPELTHLNNMNNNVFTSYTSDYQFDILRMFDVYFRVGKPLIDDNVYDGYFEIHKNLEPKVIVMFEPSINAWKKSKHIIPMGSLTKVTNIEEIEKWNSKQKIFGVPKVISEKLDGISLELVFNKGKFVKAVTRGDGLEGDDITANAIYFDGVVKELSECMDCAVRGEVVITKNNLEKINTILVNNGKDPLKNTRNGVAGQATKFKDRNEDILSLITFIAYEIQIFKIHHTGENVL